VVAVSLLLGVGLGTLGAHLVLSAGPAGSYHSPGPLLISADGYTLAGSVGSGCSAGTLEAAETANRVTVRLHVSPTLMIAPGTCAIQSFSTRLRRPLGNRQLVDGVTHRALPSFDGRTILRPGHLPEGYLHRYDTATLPDDDIPSRTAGCAQVYTTTDSWDESLWITQDIGATWSAPEGVTPQPITVRGRPGQAIPGEIAWTENGQLLTVRSRTYPYATLSTMDLIAIADSLN
jgi:hypothetical protein